MAPSARLLTSTSGGRRARLLLTAALVALALAAEYPLLKLPNLGLRQVQLRAQRCFTMRGLLLELPIDASISVFTPLRTSNCPTVLDLPVVGLHDELAMRLLGQLHVLAGPRRCVARCGPPACIQPEPR